MRILAVASLSHWHLTGWLPSKGPIDLKKKKQSFQFPNPFFFLTTVPLRDFSRQVSAGMLFTTCSHTSDMHNQAATSRPCWIELKASAWVLTGNVLVFVVLQKGDEP